MASSTKRAFRVSSLLLATALALSPVPPISTAATTSPEECGSLCSAIPTVKRWLGSLEEGRSRRAWRLMTRQSRRAIGGYEAFERESSAWAEGWGAWAEARRRDFELRVIAPMDADAASVVTMTGIVAQEGPYRRSGAALPVITRDRDTKVDPIDGRARIQPRDPREGETLKHRPRFSAVVNRIRAGSNSVYFVVKDSKVEPQRADLDRVGRRSYRATFKWPRRLNAGRHVLTISSWGRDGFKAVAVRFRVMR